MRLAWTAWDSTASAAAVSIVKVHRKYKMFLTGNSAVAVWRNTAMRHFEDLQKLVGTNMRFEGPAHKVMSMTHSRFAVAQCPRRSMEVHTD